VTVTARRVRKEQLRSGKAVRTGVTWREFDAQCQTDDEVARPGGPSGIELARSRVRVEVFASGRHDSIQQARACTRQQAIFHPRQPSPTNFFVIHGISSSSSFSLRQSCSPREFTFYPFFLHIRNYPKVCPDSPNLLNAGDSFCRNIVVNFLLSVFPNQGLDCYVLKSSRVFSVRFPELYLFQINELLHFIDFRKEFIKV
jgi:hypothetical protein